MTQSERAVTPVEVMAARVKDLRERRKLSAERLAQAMTAAGIPWERNVVANLENGRRGWMKVDELLALGKVLDVAPLHLIVPLDDDVLYQVTPTAADSSGLVRGWIRGHAPIFDDTAAAFRNYLAEQPGSELEWRGVYVSPTLTKREQIRLLRYVLDGLEEQLQTEGRSSDGR